MDPGFVTATGRSGITKFNRTTVPKNEFLTYIQLIIYFIYLQNWTNWLQWLRGVVQATSIVFPWNYNIGVGI